MKEKKGGGSLTGVCHVLCNFGFRLLGLDLIYVDKLISIQRTSECVALFSCKKENIGHILLRFFGKM